MGSDEHGQPGAALHANSRQARNHDEMIGLCKGVISDGKICAAEARYLYNWFNANPEAATVWPGKELADRLNAIWEDGEALPEELADLKELMQELTGRTNQALADLPPNLSNRLPLDEPEPTVEFKNRSFCFTGKMVCGPRAACEDMVTKRCGRISARIGADLDYLVVGLLGSRDWRQSAYGKKIIAALRYKEKGRPLKIISENTWLKAIDQADQAETKPVVSVAKYQGKPKPQTEA